MAKRKNPSVWDVRWGDDVLYVPPPKRKLAQRVEAMLNRAKRRLVPPDKHQRFDRVRRLILKMLREARRG